MELKSSILIFHDAKYFIRQSINIMIVTEVLKKSFDSVIYSILSNKMSEIGKYDSSFDSNG